VHTVDNFDKFPSFLSLQAMKKHLFGEVGASFDCLLPP